MKRISALLILLFLLTGCADMATTDIPPQAANPAPAVAGPNQIAGAVVPAPALTAPATPVSAAPAPVKVALLLPLSGKNADLGQAMLQAAQLAVFDMGYNSFELMPRDTKATPDGARAAAESAIADGAQMILGPLFSAEVAAAKPVAAMRNVNMVAFSTDWSQAGNNAFIMGFLPFSQVQRIVDYAVSKGFKRVGIIAPESDYGNAVVSYYTALTSRYGMQPVVSRLASNASDLSAAVGPFVGTVPGQPTVDAVLIAIGGDQATRLAALLTASGLGPDKVKRLGTGLWDDSPLARDPNMNGSWYAAPQPDLRKPFEKRYWDNYGQAPPRLATLSYDATALAAVLARRGASSPGQNPFTRADLTNANGFSGIDGIFRFQQDGLVDRGMAVLEMRSGAATVISPAPQTFQRPAN